MRVALIFAGLLVACGPGEPAPAPNGATNGQTTRPPAACDPLHDPCGPVERLPTTCAVPGTPPGALPQLDPVLATGVAAGVADIVAVTSTPDGLVMAVADGRLLDESGATVFETGAAVRSFARAPGDAGRWVFSHFVGGDLVVTDATADARRDIFRLPYRTAATGGAVGFDAEGNLLVGFGDDDSDELAAQDPQTFYGAVLRVTLGAPGAAPTVPADNPFDPTTGAAEVFAFGFHDPQSLAAAGGRIWVTERGRHYDEVNAIAAGKNYGWPYVDGRTCAPDVSCAPDRFAGPAVVSLRGEASCGIVGGGLYPEDGAIVELRSAFVFADACDGVLQAMRYAANGRVDADIVAVLEAGELVAMPTATTLFTAASRLDLELAADAGTAMFPTKLSQTDCFDLASGVAVARPGLVPFFVRSALWTDGAVKRRYIVVPEGEHAPLDETGHLQFPPGSLVFKSFGFEFADGAERTVELRVMRRNARTWSFFTYRFDESGDDATILPSRETAFFDVLDEAGDPLQVEYLYPDSGSCRTCHQPNRPVLGPRADQLAGPLDYGDDERDQLAELARLGLVEQSDATPLPDPTDETAPVHDRARAYLDANCSHCHRPGGWVPPDLTMDLRYATPFADAHLCGTRVQYPNPFVEGDYRIAPGSPEGSAIYQRMMLRGFGQMPLLATSVVDPLAERIIGEWITNVDCEQ